MLFMVIEHYKDQNAIAVYKRAKEKGRMLPDGLRYVDSWVEANFDRCFQLMESENLNLFQQWIIRWQDLVEVEIIPVVTSKEAAQNINKFL